MNRRTAQWWSSISNKTWQFNENPYATSWCRCPKSCVYGWQTSNVLSWYGDNGSSDSTSYDNYMYIKINEYKKQTLCCIKKYIQMKFNKMFDHLIVFLVSIMVSLSTCCLYACYWVNCYSFICHKGLLYAHMDLLKTGGETKSRNLVTNRW